MNNRWHHAEKLIPPLLIALAVALLYGHTLQVPFYLDDVRALTDNYLLRDLPATVRNLFGQRGLTNLTFALNYRLSGWDLAPLHATNIALHGGCGVLVWLLLRRLVAGGWLPLLGALLFVAHPLQTQAVTYLIQRSTVLGAFFFLLAFLCYLHARAALANGHENSSADYLRPYGGAVLAGFCALLAKENAATLPLVLFAYDRLFPLPQQRSRRQVLMTYLPFCVAPLLLGSRMFVKVWQGGVQESLYYPLASLQHNAPLNYLVTQFSVLWVYLRLLFLPYGQALEHNYPVVNQFLMLQNLLALAGWLVLGWLLWRWRRRRPLLAFGAVWFVLALAVESSVIPLDPLFEHRLYLPMFGFVLVLLDGLPALLGEKRAWAVLGIALLLWMPLTWQRNTLWNDPVAFHEANLRTVPESERTFFSLSAIYLKERRFAEGRQLLERALRLYPESFQLHINMALFYSKENRPEEAFARMDAGLRQLPDNTDLYEKAAEMAQRWDDPARAEDYLQRGLAAQDTDKARLFNNLGVLFGESGRVDEAERALLEALRHKADNAAILRNLGKEYYAQQQWSKALDVFKRSLLREPGNPEALEGMGRIALKLGDAEMARQTAVKLKASDREAWQRLQFEITKGSRQ